MNPRVSVYVPSFNAERTIRTCLESIISQTVPFDQITVIDDGSYDRTAEVAAEFDVEIVRNPVNQGIGACRNICLKKARNRLVAAVDADCVLDNDWLATLLPHLKSPRVAVAGGALHERDVSTLADLWRSEHMPQNWGDELLTSPPFLFGCNTLCRRDALLSLGGYDERLMTNGEDVDISRRLRRDGWTLLYDPHARVSHLQRDSLSSVMARWWRYHNLKQNPGVLSDVARNAPRYLSHGLRFIRRDVVSRPHLLWLDLLFPLAQLYFDACHFLRGRT